MRPRRQIALSDEEMAAQAPAPVKEEAPRPRPSEQRCEAHDAQTCCGVPSFCHVHRQMVAECNRAPSAPWSTGAYKSTPILLDHLGVLVEAMKAQMISTEDASNAFKKLGLGWGEMMVASPKAHGVITGLDAGTGKDETVYFLGDGDTLEVKYAVEVDGEPVPAKLSPKRFLASGLKLSAELLNLSAPRCPVTSKAHDWSPSSPTRDACVACGLTRRSPRGGSGMGGGDR